MSTKFVENYENMSDGKIVEMINGGNYELLQLIIERYYPVILRYVRDYCPQTYAEDAVQEATLALYSAVHGYDPEKSSFSTFASLCIKRSVLSVVKQQQRKKVIPNGLISTIDGLEIADGNTPEKIFFDKESYRALADTIRLELSSLEYEVLQLYLSGSSYRNISERLGISEKAVDNALTRIRKKLRTDNA